MYNTLCKTKKNPALNLDLSSVLVLLALSTSHTTCWLTYSLLNFFPSLFHNSFVASCLRFSPLSVSILHSQFSSNLHIQPREMTLRETSTTLSLMKNLQFTDPTGYAHLQHLKDCMSELASLSVFQILERLG